MIECEDIFENLEIVLDDEHEEIDSVCVQALRDLAKRDDFLEALTTIVKDKVMELCEELSELQETVDTFHGYYDYSLEEFVI